MYKCGHQGCEKAYGTLNHLNAHVTMQSHGAKRTPEGEFGCSFPLRSMLCLQRLRGLTRGNASPVVAKSPKWLARACLRSGLYICTLWSAKQPASHGISTRAGARRTLEEASSVSGLLARGRRTCVRAARPRWTGSAFCVLRSALVAVPGGRGRWNRSLGTLARVPAHHCARSSFSSTFPQRRPQRLTGSAPSCFLNRRQRCR